jgi:hypothetical protein
MGTKWRGGKKCRGGKEKKNVEGGKMYTSASFRHMAMNSVDSSTLFSVVWFGLVCFSLESRDMSMNSVDSSTLFSVVWLQTDREAEREGGTEREGTWYNIIVYTYYRERTCWRSGGDGKSGRPEERQKRPTIGAKETYYKGKRDQLIT